MTVSLESPLVIRGRPRGLAAMLAATALAMAVPPESFFVHDGTPSPWRTKLRDTATTVAAMKRQARKRRNVRARQSKRA